jgi:thiamine-monophosphate kinase
MKEFSFIAAIRRMLGPARAPVQVGVGDDAAVLTGSRRPQVVTMDTQIEGIHFRLEWQPPRAVAARAVEITLSDLAAMGARPKALFVAVSFPENLQSRAALALARGLCAAGNRRGAPVAGGNVAVYQGPLALTLTALGELPPGRTAFLRSAARPGEAVYVTGVPGLARLGLEALSRRGPTPRELRQGVKKFLQPHACFEELEFLAKKIRLGAVIDLSDGLGGDLGHVLEASAVGAELEPRYPPSFLRACRCLGLEPEECFLGPSDDYELLFTARQGQVEPLVAVFKKRFRRDLLRLGRISSRRGLWILTPTGRRRVTPRSFEHTTS